MENKNLKILGGIIAIAVLVLLVFYIPRFLEEGTPRVCTIDGECQHEAYLNNIITYLPAIIILGFLFGVIVAYFYFERKVELPVPSTDSRKAILSMLSPSERKIVGKAVEKDGEVLQSEISRMEGIGKVRAHRVIDRLIRRGVLEKEEMGKTNILRLRKDIKDALKQV